MKDFFIPPKTEESHCHQTYAIRNIQGNSSGRRSKIPDRNLDLHKQKVPEMVKVKGIPTIYSSQLQMSLQFIKTPIKTLSSLLPILNYCSMNCANLSFLCVLNHLSQEPKFYNYPTSNFSLLRHS